jgi:hypothetical protein
LICWHDLLIALLVTDLEQSQRRNSGSSVVAPPALIERSELSIPLLAQQQPPRQPFLNKPAPINELAAMRKPTTSLSIREYCTRQLSVGNRRDWPDRQTCGRIPYSPATWRGRSAAQRENRPNRLKPDKIDAEQQREIYYIYADSMLCKSLFEAADDNHMARRRTSVKQKTREFQILDIQQPLAPWMFSDMMSYAVGRETRLASERRHRAAEFLRPD